MKLNNISTGILIVCILAGIVTAATTISDTSISVDNLILGGQTIVAYTAALNTKLSGIETLADVTDNTNVNTAGAVMESDIPDQSFTNLLVNHDFNSWSNGAAAAPDGWTHGGAGGSIAQSATHKINTYSALLTRSGTNTYLNAQVSDYARYASKSLTIGSWVYAASGVTGVLQLYDGVTTLDQGFSGNDAWQFISGTLSADASISELRLRLYVNTDGAIYFDGVTLVEGLVCPAASPKPLVDDGIMLQEHTPSSASDYGATGQWCYDDNYIYVCNNTDTWIRTTLSTW